MARYSLVNRGKQILIASDVELADTSWSRMKGLLGRKAEDFPPGSGLWIVPSQGVHTIGMGFAIDVVYLDSDQRVIHLCHELSPYRIAAIKWKARSVVELPAGTLARTQTSLGDRLELKRLETEKGAE